MSPRMSIVVVAFDMPHQSLNTLRSLTAPYQRDISADEFEVILVENESGRMLGEQAATAVAPNVRYFRRDNEARSPVPSLIFGLEQARGRHLGVVIDGARMVTPRVLTFASAAFRITPHAVVAVPGYHLGDAEQHRNPDHDEDYEKRLLAGLDWYTDGYRLFEVSVFFRGRHQDGFLLPLMESNCLFFSREALEAVGGIDERFDMQGGGMVNLDLYRQLLLRREARLFITAGEGTFHQFHGGVTTKADDGREELLAAFREQYERIRGDRYRMVHKRPTLIGAVPGWAMSALEYSAACAMRAHL